MFCLKSKCWEDETQIEKHIAARLRKRKEAKQRKGIVTGGIGLCGSSGGNDDVE
jgi:hypothetical protein